MTTNQLEADAYSKITTTILGGVNVTHQLYGVYCHTWAPLDPRGAGLRLRDQSGHDAVQDTGGNVHGDQLPTTITSMWADKDIFQALLHSDDYIVLTTHPHNEKLASQSILLEAIQVGTIWDYAVMCRGQTWVAKATCEHISDVHQKVASMPTNRWVGKHYKVTTRQNRPGLTIPGHKAFIPTHIGQVLTSISPPLWVWEDDRKLAGSWCHLATTYIGLCHESTLHTNEVYTGLVQISTLGCTGGERQ